MSLNWDPTTAQLVIEACPLEDVHEHGDDGFPNAGDADGHTCAFPES